eukprot:5376298-Alexandrium_andersonii.AAC.1
MSDGIGCAASVRNAPAVLNALPVGQVVDRPRHRLAVHFVEQRLQLFEAWQLNGIGRHGTGKG